MSTPMQSWGAKIKHWLKLSNKQQFGSAGFPHAPRRNQADNALKLVNSILRKINNELELTQTALRQSEEKFRIIADNTYDWEFWIDPKGQFVYSSPSCLRITGYAPDAFIQDATLFERIIHPDDQEIVRLHSCNLENETGKQVEFRVIRPDETVCWVGHVCQPIIDQDGNALGARGSNRDINQRKLAEMRLRQSEEALRKAQRVSLVGSWKWDIKTGQLEWSEEMYHIFGIEKDNFSGALQDVIAQAIHPDDRERVKLGNRLVAEKIHPKPLEYRVVWPDQSVHTVWAEAGEIILDPAGSPAFLTGIVQDITERRRVDETLRKVSRAVEQSPASIIIADLSGSIEYINPKFCTLTGYTASEVLGQNPRLLKSGKTPQQEYDRLWQIISSGGEWKGEFCNRKKNGELYWEMATISPIFDEMGAITHYLAVKEDITERKLAEEALHNADQFNLQVIQGAAEGVVVFDIQLRCKVWNPFMEKLTGFTAAEVIDRTLPELNPPIDVGTFLEILTQALNGKTIHTSDISFQSQRMAQPAWLSAVVTPQVNSLGEVVGVICLIRDITERIQVDAMRKELTVLHEMDHLRDELIGNVSHELRTPLGLILVMVTALKKDILQLDQDTRNEFLEDIEEETHNLQSIVNGMLDVSRLQNDRLALNWKPTDLGQTINTTVQRVASQDPYHQFICRLPQERLEAVVDEERIEQVLRNLLDNAIKYSPAATRVEVSLVSRDESIYISVADEGPGIPSDEREHIFERFYRITNPNTPNIPGIGLGLSICRGIVEAHNGKMWVTGNQMEDGSLIGGSKFTFTLPTKAALFPPENGEFQE